MNNFEIVYLGSGQQQRAHAILLYLAVSEIFFKNVNALSKDSLVKH